jgi:hypothetical protein
MLAQIRTLRFEVSLKIVNGLLKGFCFAHA